MVTDIMVMHGILLLDENGRRRGKVPMRSQTRLLAVIPGDAKPTSLIPPRLRGGWTPARKRWRPGAVFLQAL
jgi:hypothetical protein